MTTMLQSLFLSAAALSILPGTVALEWLGPRATRTPSLPNAQGFSPKPTNGPQFDIVAKSNLGHDLLRRQVRSQDIQTCGYVDGNGALDITCDAPYACAFNTKLSAFGCCSGQSTGTDGTIYFTDSCFIDTLTTICYASSEADLCTGECTKNAQICSGSSRPICRTIGLFGTAPSDSRTYTQYDCVPSGGATLLSLQDTYTTSNSFVTPNPLFDSAYTFSGSTLVPISPGTTSTRTSGTSRTTSRPGPTTADPSISDPGPEAKKSNTGAIAGGVVGGLVALGLLIGGLIWVLIRRKEKARVEAAATMNEVTHTTYVHEGK